VSSEILSPKPVFYENLLQKAHVNLNEEMGAFRTLWFFVELPKYSRGRSRQETGFASGPCQILASVGPVAGLERTSIRAIDVGNNFEESQ